MAVQRAANGCFSGLIADFANLANQNAIKTSGPGTRFVVTDAVVAGTPREYTAVATPTGISWVTTGSVP